jgi:hypothetical protein
MAGRLVAYLLLYVLAYLLLYLRAAAGHLRG